MRVIGSPTVRMIVSRSFAVDDYIDLGAGKTAAADLAHFKARANV